MDLTVSGKAYINNSFNDCCIGIKDGKISEIKKILKSDKHIDFGKKLIIPAGTDIHVHFRDPGMIHKEDFSSGTLAAAFGGISCVFDMPNTTPQTTTMQTLSDKIIVANRKSYVDFGIYAGVTNNNLSQIETLAKKASGFKIFLGTTTNALHFDKKNLKDTLNRISKTNRTALIHAEDEICLSKNKSKENNLSDHLRSRPAGCEEIAIKDILKASKSIESKIHICHLSSCEGMELLRNRPKNISCGATPHHLILSAEDKLLPQSHYKVNPPIRTNLDKEMLFNSIKNGNIDNIESDHAPHTLDEKDVDFDIAPTGLPGVETMFPLFLYLAKKEALSFNRVFSLMCERPAEIVDIPKGKLQVGMDADFIVLDLKEECKIESDNLHSKCGWTPFEGWPAIFPSHVFVRGENIIDDYEIQVSRGFGKLVGE